MPVVSIEKPAVPHRAKSLPRAALLHLALCPLTTQDAPAYVHDPETKGLVPSTASDPPPLP